MPLTALVGAAAARLRTARLTCPEVGRTAGELPVGYRHLRRSALLGSGPRVFTASTTGPLNWQLHLNAGIDVLVSGPAATRTDVLLRTWTGPVRVAARCGWSMP